MFARLAEELGDNVSRTAAGFRFSAGQEVPAGMESNPKALANASKGETIQAVQAGFEGGGSTAGLAEFFTGQKRKVKLTQEQADAANVETDRQRESVRLKAELRKLGRENVDPVESDNKNVDRYWYGFLNLAGSAASFAMPGGAALNLNAYISEETSRLESEGVDPETAAIQAIGVGSAQAAMDKLSLSLMGRLFSLRSFRAALAAPASTWAGSLAKRIPGAVAVAGAEAVVEGGQQAVPLLVQKALSALGVDEPDVPWEKIGQESFAATEQTFFAMLPLVMIGLGVGGSRDYRATRKIVSDRPALSQLGFTPETVKFIASAPDASTGVTRLREAWGSRVPITTVPVTKGMQAADTILQDPTSSMDQVREAAKVRAEMERRVNASEAWRASLERENIKMDRIIRDGKPVYRVTRKDVVTEHADEGAAVAAAMDHMTDADRVLNAPMMEMLSLLGKRTTSPLQESDVTILAQQMTALEYLTDSQARSNDTSLPKEERDRAAAENKAMLNRLDILAKTQPDLVRDDGTIDASNIFVGGQSDMVKTKEGLYRAVLKIANGEGAYVVLEEFVEADANAWVASGQTTWAELAEMIREVETKTAEVAARRGKGEKGDIYLKGYTEGEDIEKDVLAVKEAYSLLVQVYVTSQSRAAQSDTSKVGKVARVDRQLSRKNLRQLIDSGEMNPTLATRLMGYVKFMRTVLPMALKLNRARREAGGSFRIDEFLNKSLGLDTQAEHAKEVVREAEQIISTEGTYGPGFNLRAMDAEYERIMDGVKDLASTAMENVRTGKDGVKRGRTYSPKIRELLNRRDAGEKIPFHVFARAVKEHFPSFKVPVPKSMSDLPTGEEVLDAVTSDKREAHAATLEMGAPKEGDDATLRQDVPAQTEAGVGVVTLKTENGNLYLPAVRARNPRMVTNEKQTVNIAKGGAKGPHIVIKATYTADQSMPEDLENWTQVGFNPDRASYYYERGTERQVVSGSEIYQVGNTAFIKDAKFEDRITDLSFSLSYKKNPDATHEVFDSQTGNVVWEGIGREAANKVRDNRDNKYGGYRYRVREKAQPPAVTPDPYEDPTSFPSFALKSAQDLEAEINKMSASELRKALEDAKLTTSDAMVNLLGHYPEYLVPVAKYIVEKRQDLVNGRITIRDVAKSYWITVASIGASAIDVSTVKTAADAAGLDFNPDKMFLSKGAKGQDQMRPEELAAWWLGTPQGQNALKKLDEGKFDPADWESGLAARDAFGRNDLRDATTGKGSYVPRAMGKPSAGQVNFQNLQKAVDDINASKGDPKLLEKALMQLNGIGEGKKGFIGHMLGFGDWATIDAVELNVWLTGSGDTTRASEDAKRIAGIAKRASGTAATNRDLFKRIRDAISSMRDLAKGAKAIPEEVAAHIIHHWIWDRAKGIETTHKGVYHAMTSFSLSAGASAQDVNGLTGNESTYTDTTQSNVGGRDAGVGTGTRSLAPLEGAPSVRGAEGPDPRLVAVAENYARENGFTLLRQSEYVTVDDDRGKRISDAYEAMPHAPNDPVVREAYDNLIKQTTAQYNALVNAGYKFWLIDPSLPGNAEYVKSPYNALRDIRSTQQMGVFPTRDGFGTGGPPAGGNRMLEETDIEWPRGGLNGPMEKVFVNDLFRAVHDAFGHGLEGSGFRARGEENAWQAHVRLYTGSAVGAITSETRGQNSWLNYGPAGAANQKASTDDTVFAEQKTGLMPEWTWTEGRAGDMLEDSVPSFKLQAGGFDQTFFKETEKFAKAVAEGRAIQNVPIKKFAGKTLMLHQPDMAFAGGIAKDMEEIITGGGGVYYPLLFGEEGHFWASTRRAAEAMADALNEIGKQNGGTILMGLTATGVDKLFSSTSMSTGVINFLEKLTQESGKYGITREDLNRMIVQASKISVTKNVKGKDGIKRPVTYTFEGLSLNIEDGLNPNISGMREVLKPDNSVFAMRKGFVEEMMKLLAEHLESNKPASKELAALLIGPGNDYYKRGKIGKGNLSKAALIQGFGNMLSEPFLRTFQQFKGGGQLYAIIEIKGPVKAVASSNHASYPFSIVSAKKTKAKAKVHVLAKGYQWTDVITLGDTNQPVPDDLLEKVYPTSGVTSPKYGHLKVKAPDKGAVGTPLSFSLREGAPEVAPADMGEDLANPSFRLSPTATLDRLAADIERRKRDPEMRRKIYDRMRGALETLRTRWMEVQPRYNAQGMQTGESTILVEQKSKKELDKEQAFREAMVLDRELAARGMTAQDAARSKDSKDYEMWQRFEESKDLLMKGGMSEWEATALADFGSTKWRADFVAAIKEARDIAKEEVFDWRAQQDEMQRKDWDARAVMLRHLRTLDAVLSALPSEVRGKVGGWTAIASLKTQAAMQKELGRRLAVADEQLEKALKKDALANVMDVIEKARPLRESGKKPQGKLGAEGHRFFDEVERVVGMSEDAVIGEHAMLESKMADATTDEERANIFEQQQVLDVFGNLKGRGAAHITRALDQLEFVFENKRNMWRMVEESRLGEVAAKVEAMKSAVGKVSYSKIGANKDKALKALGILKNGSLSLKSFAEVLETLLGRNHPLAKEWAAAARQAMAQRTDEVIASAYRWRKMSEKATGKKGVKAQRALWDMSTVRDITFNRQPVKITEIKVPIESMGDPAALKALGLSTAEITQLEDDFMALDADSQKKNLTVKRTTLMDAEAVPTTQAEGIYLTMLWAQEQYRDALTLHGFGEEAQAEIESGLSDAAKQIRVHLTNEYRDNYEPLARQFRNMFGVDLPSIPNYAPGRHYNQGSNDQQMDITGSGQVEGGFRQGFLGDRKPHKAAPRAENAFQVYFGHVNQSAHWRAMAPLARELRGVFGNAELKQAIESNFGQDMSQVIQKWIGALEGNGIKQAHSRLMTAIMNSQAYVALAWKLGTLAKQSSALLGAAYRMPPGAYLRGLGKLMTGRLEYGDMWRSQLIQRRLDGGWSPEVRAAMASAFGGKPSYRKAALQEGMELIGFVDAAFTTGSAAIAYDYHFRNNLKTMGEAEARALAMDEAANVVSRTAQPVEITDRSLFEMELGAFGKTVFMFTSEARQKSAMTITAWGNTLTGKATAEDLRVLAISHLIVGPMIQMIGAIWSDMRDDDDDELFDDKYWNPLDFLRAVALGPFSGVPVLRDVIDAYDGESGPLASVAKGVQSGAALIKGPPDSEKETTEWYEKKLMGVINGLGIAVPELAVAANIVDQVFRVADNAKDSPEEITIKIDRLERKRSKEKDPEKRQDLSDRIKDLRE